MPANNVMSLSIDTKVAQDAEKVVAKEEQQPTSPEPFSPVLYLKEDKDTLAYEHDRQKYMKTLDRARNKARKAFSWGNGGGSPRRPSSNGHPAPERSIKAGEEDKELASEYFHVSDVQVHRTVMDAVICTEKLFTEVKLADLVVLASDDPEGQAKGGAKKKRTRIGKGGLDGEYEVVPHVRSVIVLEEQRAADLDWDDPWECVEDESSDDGAEKKNLEKATYATVAAAAVETT